MANEATAALTDAYGHVMHGDDAGSSARLVWVVHPTKVPIEVPIGGDVPTASNLSNVGASVAVATAKGVASPGGKKNRLEDSSASSRVVGSPGRNGNAVFPSSYLFTQKFGEWLTHRHNYFFQRKVPSILKRDI